MATFTLVKPCIQYNPIQTIKPEFNSSFAKSIKQWSSSRFGNGRHQVEGGKSNRGSRIKVKALPDWPLMAVLVEHMEGQRDLITHKSIWHLSDQTIKNTHSTSCSHVGDVVSLAPQRIHTMIQKHTEKMEETVLDIGSTIRYKFLHIKQEDMEEAARAELWREELIEEIEQKVGGLRELEEAGKKEEELVK